MLAPTADAKPSGMLRKLEKYEIYEEIGHGGMATVYRAHDTVLDRQVALKVMHPHLRGAEEARRRFHREARSVARLRHPCVLEIYDFSGEGSSEAYLAAELLTGPTLKRWREDQKDVPAEIAACIGIEIARALEAAHEAGIVHRDVKPENVLLHEDRCLKLTDFGIADMVDAQSMTATGQILGSPGHMAPEQIEGRETDVRTDLFSLGTVLYYLATGRLPFTGRNPHQVLKRIMDGEYADPLRVSPAIGGRMRGIIVKSLERDPALRFQNAAELRETLEAFVGDAGFAEPAALLARYLQDPEGVGAEITKQTVESLIERGARASDDGDVPTALDCFNRVLALDEGNERVLKLIERVGMDRRRRRLMVTGGGLIAFGMVASLGAWALWPDEDDRPVTPLVLRAIPDGGLDAGETEVDAGAEIDDDAGPSAPDARAPSSRDAGSVAAGRGGRSPRIARSRTVRFVSAQQNLRIGVDGQTPRPISEFRTSTLTLGPHSLRIEPDEQSRSVYEARTLAIRVEAGEDEQEIAVSMQLQPAPLYVESSVPAQVDVQNRVRGRTNELLRVPMRRERETLRVTVEAPGYRPATFVTAPLSAGGTTVEVRVDLEPLGAPGE